jgi:hypothetical protein
MARIADILSKARKQHFTGREREIAEFRQLLNEPELSYHILFLYGPAGQGKTTLVREFTELCRLNQNPYLHLDAREIIPSTAGFYQALCDALNVNAIQQVMETFERSEKTFVLFIDTYKKLSALDNWLREEFLPQLPENVLTVFSARNHPSPQWLSDPGWHDLIKTVQLRNFSPSESRLYLERRKVPPDQFEKILDFTHGHPLALSMVADLFLQKPKTDFSIEESPDIVQRLLDHFLLKVPSPAHKTALEICAITYVTTESLLASVMGTQNAHELFEWLKNLSFIESNKFGLYPHDLARESLAADLKWRNPDWFTHLYRKTGDYYISKLENASGEEQRKLLFALTYLQRRNPAVRPFYHWEENNEFWVDLMKPEDVKPLTKMVESFYGKEAVKQFQFWLSHPAAQVWVWRSPANQQSAFVMRINVNELEDKQKIKDEVMERAIAYVNDTFHLRKGEVATVFRFWMASETQQHISKLQSSVFLFITQYYLTTKGLAAHLLAVENPGFWKTLLNYYGMEHVPLLDFATGSKEAGFYMHDVRKTPPKLWLNNLSLRESASAPVVQSALQNSEMIVLSEAEFFDSTYNALKDYHSEKKLEGNPLIHSRFVLLAQDVNGPTIDRIQVLKNQIDSALKRIEESPRDDRFHRLLYRTFINPVGSQEQAAEFLTLPFSTYRRHLKKAVGLVTDILWRQETS